MAKPITQSDIMAMIEEQQYRCALTGRELTPETCALDHKQPLAKGGTNEIDNLWIIHHEANAAKGTLSVSEFVSLCCDVAEKWHETSHPPVGVQFCTENAAPDLAHPRQGS